MATPFQSKSSSDNIYTVLIVIFGLVLGYILYSNALIPLADNGENEIAVVPPDAENIARLEAIKFDFTIFDNIIFKELRIFGEIPVIPGVTGKADPFSP